MDKYQNIAARFFNQPWAIMQEKLQEIAGLIEFKMSGGTVDEETIKAMVGAQFGSAISRAGAVAVLPIFGTITPRANMMSSFSGGVSIDVLTRRFSSLVDDPGVGAIILDIDSPGGSVEGLDEFADEVFTLNYLPRVESLR